MWTTDRFTEAGHRCKGITPSVSATGDSFDQAVVPPTGRAVSLLGGCDAASADRARYSSRRKGIAPAQPARRDEDSGDRDFCFSTDPALSIPAGRPFTRFCFGWKE